MIAIKAGVRVAVRGSHPAISFRAWHDKEMSYVYHIGLHSMFAKGTIPVYPSDSWASPSYDLSRAKPEQYIGLSDIHGLPLFEHDIVLCSYRPSDKAHHESWYAEIVRDTVNPCFVLKRIAPRYFGDDVEYDFVKTGLLTLELQGSIRELDLSGVIPVEEKSDDDINQYTLDELRSIVGNLQVEVANYQDTKRIYDAYLLEKDVDTSELDERLSSYFGEPKEGHW